MNTTLKPMLGTAMWGWTTPKEKCFDMLDYFYESGHRVVDAATNYPINKQPKDFRASERILAEWIDTHGITDLEIMMKVGSINNMRTPDHNLSKSFLLILLDEYQEILGHNLHTFMVHWDNREVKNEIAETFQAFELAHKQGLKIGLSGIKHPDLYHQLNEGYNFPFIIQIKHNILYSDYQRYHALHHEADFIAYGINAGGLKLEADAYTPQSSLVSRGGNIDSPPKQLVPLREAIKKANRIEGRQMIDSINQCGLIFAHYHSGVVGVLLGTSKVDQLKNSLQFMSCLQKEDYSDLYQDLKKIHEGAI
jgi:aryl-alcohol dehydrogenase-like predicted oxidoreductase